MQGKLKQNKRGVRRILSAVLAACLVLGGITLSPIQKVQAAGENLVKNPNFAEADMSAWQDTGATIKADSQDEPIFDDVKTFATISGRTQTYQGFSQDVTDVAEPGAEYEISFYVKLSEDYKDLKGSERQVFFGPMVVSDGITNYLSQSYSSEISGNLVQEIPVGEWVQLSGKFKAPKSFTQLVLRFQEESSKNKGSYSITGVSMKKTEAPKVTVEYQFEDIPSLKEAIKDALGEDTIVGMVTHPVDNEKEWALLTKHANAVTTGNELKPDSNFGYSNAYCPGKETITFNGKELLVPKVDWSRSERFIDAVYQYNQENPNNQIKIRGHVLVWHAQTPEWFFHEDYDASKPYVSKELLDRRLEWYIKTILEHYVGPDSKYKDMFYGWDVVNEACVGGSQVYRDDKGGSDKLTDPTHDNKSSWWHVYQSNEYIINAFKYANKYAPASVELYYNDFGEIWPDKMTSICELLKAVKEQEGAPGVGTRIDGYGMQAHYGLNDFSIENFETAARAYLDVVGKIQLTELDMAASSNYDGTDATEEQEYMEQALVYQQIFEVLQELDAIPGYEVGGITFWGVTDPYSWLQHRSTVGGGQDGTQKQCPLLFDGNYEAKPAYWAFVDASNIKIVQKKVQARRSFDGKFKDGITVNIGTGDYSATMIPIWDEEGLKLQVEVKDKTLDGVKDYVTLYLDEEMLGMDGITPQTITIDREEASSIGGGYRATFTVPMSDLYYGKEFLFDVKITNASAGELSFNDVRNSQEYTSRNYALCTFAPALTRVSKGTPVVDGEKESVWDSTDVIWLNAETAEPQADAKCRILWDEKKAYFFAEVEGVAESEAGQTFLEVYLDENNSAGVSYDKDDKYYQIGLDGTVKAFGKRASDQTVEATVTKTEQGYAVEASFDWTDLSPKVHNLVGFDVKVRSVDANGKMKGIRSFSDVKDEASERPSAFGTIKLAAPEEEQPDGDNVDAKFRKVATKPATSEATDEEQKDQSAQDFSKYEVKEKKPLSKGAIAAIICVVILGGGAIAAGVLLHKKRKETAKTQKHSSKKKSGGYSTGRGATKKKYRKKKKR